MTKEVNKFLTKSYHMISSSDPNILSWNGVGDSFTIEDIDAFQKHILPKYFSHSKYSSYVRQLNFYGFQKMSQDSDIRIVPKVIVDDESSHASESVNSTSNQQNPSSSSSSTPSTPRFPFNNSARFMHEYFRRGMPELLPKIQRSTAKPKLHMIESQDYEALHKEIASLKGQINQMESQVDRKVELAVQLVRNDYMTKVTRLEASYQSLVSIVSLMRGVSASQPSSFILQQFLAASKHTA